jgi:nucleotide-binding universal stress UspA family protein
MQTYEPTVSVSLKNILLATDLSPASERAFEFAQAFAREHAAVHTLHVSGADNYQLLCPEAFAATFASPRDYRSAAKVLSGLLEGLPCEVPVHGSHVWEVIADVSARNEIDLLIVGTHGRKGLRKLLFGSIAEEVFRDVSCPVLTVGSDVAEPGADGLNIKNVLLATDCKSGSLAPIYAAWLCQRFRAQLVGLYVASKDKTPQVERPFDLEKQLLATAPEINDLERRAEFAVKFGDPAEKILQMAREIEASLIVLGAHAPRDVRTVAHLPWATASRVICGAACPVLTVGEQTLAKRG